MAYQNKIISNPVTGQGIRFLKTKNETSGELLEMEATYNSHSKEPVPHYHPAQAEDFTVIEGKLMVRVQGQIKELGAGDSLHIPANMIHSMWNNSDGKTIVNWQIRPAMNTDHLLETATGLASDGKTNKEGMPNILQVALMANKFAAVFRLAKPPFIIQKIVFIVLTPFAYLLGYRPTYKKYLD
jgi:quercetin dioxygenase-like cupin family protein